MSSREQFLERVREAVAQGNRAGAKAELPSRGSLGYQGAGSEPVIQFCEMLRAAGGFAHVVNTTQEAADKVVQLVIERSAKSVLLENTGVPAPLGLKAMLEDRGVQVRTVDDLTAETCRETFFSADIGITGVRYLIAETGSLVMASAAREPRSGSLLPPVHIAVAHRSQVLADLFDLFDVLKSPPSCLTLITGPSKTGDIELKLVTGVHGPGEVHVMLIDS